MAFVLSLATFWRIVSEMMARQFFVSSLQVFLHLPVVTGENPIEDAERDRPVEANDIFQEETPGRLSKIKIVQSNKAFAPVAQMDRASVS